MTDFKPPINERSTSDLLHIVAKPHEWTSEAVEQASLELSNRKVPEAQLEHALYICNKERSIAQKRLAEEGFNLLDFIDSPIKTLFDMTIYWELKKDGYLKKARQQKWIRLVVIFIIAIIFYSNLLL